MKHPYFLSLAAALFVAAPLTRLQADQNWDGGSNVWDYNSTVDWDNGSNPWENNLQYANFNSTPGTVTVDDSKGAVGAYGVGFSGNAATWDLTGGPLSMTKSGYDAIVYNNNGGGTTTIDSQLNVDVTADTDRYNFYDQSGGTGGTLVLGNVSFVGPLAANANPNRSMIVGSSNNGTKIYMNGTYTDSSATGGPGLEVRLGEGGADQMNYYLNGNFTGMSHGISIGEGNVNVGSSAVLGTHTINIYNDQGEATQNSALYGTQGITIANNIYLSAKYDDTSTGGSRYGNGTVGVSDASSVTFTGGIGLDSTNLILDAHAGGRATISTNGIGNASPEGLTKTGAGTVVLATANTYSTFADGRDNADAGTVAMDIKAGTLLANNGTSGSALGNNSAQVLVEAGATLGGNGQTSGTQLTKAMAATAVIAAGDAGQANLGINPTIGTLDLQGGLEADSGLNMNFKLTGEGLTEGESNDFLEVSSFTLGGTVTVNLSALDALETGTGNDYVLFSDSNGDSDSATAANFDVIAPTGYALDSSFDGNGGNGGFDYSDGVLRVQLVATPEPSTWAMMLGGLALVGFCVRRKLA